MRVRSFEIADVADTDLRALHDYLLEVGGFEFTAGGAGFFVVVGERFMAASGARHAQVIMATRESDTINIDIVAAGGAASEGDSQLALVQRSTELVRAFADRLARSITDI